ncbi:MAG: rhomboid family intramembrane serine protease [Myxococcales bacterium]|nr:rhomboid family intramembrane serine protease [Myxococcales bacterium]
MIVPLFHDRMTVRRWPWVTSVIVLLSIVVFVALRPAQASAEEHTVAAATAALAFHADHPDLEARGTLAELEARMGRRAGRGRTHHVYADPRDRDDDQRTLDELAAALDAAIADEPHHRLGYGPRSRVPGVLTSLFVHGSFAHVLFNMWFLALCGMNLEDRWGRPWFLAFYLVGGVIATLGHGVFSSTTVIGASGAVAAAMGAFLVLFAKVRIRFLVLVGVTFRAPAWAALPLWAAVELFHAVRADDGISHSAHLFGFAFGVVTAALLRGTGLDRRLDDAVEKASTLGDDPRADTALALARAGKVAAARAMLDGLVLEQPDSVHAHRALYFTAIVGRDAARAEVAKQRVLTLYERAGERATGEAILADLTTEALTASQKLGPAAAAPSFDATGVATPSPRPSYPLAPAASAEAPRGRADPDAPRAAARTAGGATGDARSAPSFPVPEARGRDGDG